MRISVRVCSVVCVRFVCELMCSVCAVSACACGCRRDAQCKLNASPLEAVRVNAGKALANLAPAGPSTVDAENSRPSERSPAPAARAGATAPSR